MSMTEMNAFSEAIECELVVVTRDRLAEIGAKDFDEISADDVAWMYSELRNLVTDRYFWKDVEGHGHVLHDRETGAPVPGWFED